MNASSLGQWLAKVPLLEGASAEVLELCATEAVRIELQPQDTLIRTGERHASLYLLLRGSMQVQFHGEQGSAHTVAQIGEGAVLGEIQAVTGQVSTADVLAMTPCSVLSLDKNLLRSIGKHFPLFDERLIAIATRRLHQVIFRRTVDSLLTGMDEALVDAFLGCATEVTIERGATLFLQGDVADAWYVLTSGRLSVVTGSDADQQRVAHLMAGASVGETALITGGLRSASVRAERKSTLMRLSKEDFERFAEAHTVFARRLMGIMVDRMYTPAAKRRHGGAQVLVVMRASDSGLLESALQQLSVALRGTVGATFFDRQEFEKTLGHAMESAESLTETHPVWGRFDLWLQEAQNNHGLVLLDAGHADDLWRSECLLHADQCLWLVEPVAADASLVPADQLARLLSSRQWTQRNARHMPCTLLVAHPPTTVRPRQTRVWLDSAHFDRHFHLRVDHAPSMARTARLLAGQGIGLALSGGGARGLAHIGVIKAFLEAGVPIDCVGGTSMGAIQAGMFAMGLSVDEMEQLNARVIANKPFQEYTLPLIALVASRRRDACIEWSFADVQIEDLWIPFLAVSTDLHGAQAHVHERGSLGLAASASSSLPGILVPVLDGPRILVDGGVVNNLPANLVKARCGGTVFGSNVAPQADLVAPQGGFPSPWSVLLRRLLPWRKAVTTPRLGDILIRTMTVGSSGHMQRVTQDMDVLIEPDVEGFGMLQFKAMKPLMERGYAAAQRSLKAWAESRPA